MARDTEFKLVIGDERMVLYRAGRKVMEGVHLTFMDMFDACSIPCDIFSADLEWSASKWAQGEMMPYPDDLDEVPFEDEDKIPGVSL